MSPQEDEAEEGKKGHVVSSLSLYSCFTYNPQRCGVCVCVTSSLCPSQARFCQMQREFCSLGFLVVQSPLPLRQLLKFDSPALLFSSYFISSSFEVFNEKFQILSSAIRILVKCYVLLLMRHYSLLTFLLLLYITLTTRFF